MALTITYNSTDYQCYYIWRATSGGTVFSSNLYNDTAFDYFDDSPTVNDAIYFIGFYSNGSYRCISNLKFNIGTAMAGTDIVLLWEYYSTSGWVPIENFTDNTSAFTATGQQTLVFPIQEGWRWTTINGLTNKFGLRCRLVSFSSVTEGGAQTTDTVKTNDGQVIVSGTTEETPATWDQVWSWLDSNAPEVCAEKWTIATNTDAGVFRFPHCMITLSSPLETNNEIVFLGNDAGYLFNNFYYLRSGTLQEGGGFINPSSHYYSNQSTGSGGIFFNYNSKVYGGTLGVFGSARRGSVGCSGGEFVGVNFESPIGVHTNPVQLTNCIMAQSFLMADTDVAPTKGLQFINAQGYGYVLYMQTSKEMVTRFDEFTWAEPTSGFLFISYYLGRDGLVCRNPTPKLPDHSAALPVTKRIIYSAENLGKCFFYDESEGTYTDYTTESTGTGDVPLYGDVGDIIYFMVSGAGIRALPCLEFTIPGGQTSNDYVYALETWNYYASGGSNWRDLKEIDASYNFTETGIVYCAQMGQSNKTVNGTSGWWVRARITSKGSGSPVATKIQAVRQSGTGTQLVADGPIYWWRWAEAYSVDVTAFDEDGNEINATISVTDKNGDHVDGSPFETDLIHYPPEISADYVKSTTAYSVAGFEPYKAADPDGIVNGQSIVGAWFTNATGNQRFHIDLGSAKTITGIKYENYHTRGAETDVGAKAFTFWGSNDSDDFDDLTYGNDGTWTQIGGSLQFDEHSSENAADPKTIAVSNSTAYRYYAIKISTNWGDGTYIGMRQVLLTSTTPQSPLNGNWLTTVTRRRYEFDPLNFPSDYQVGTEDLNPYTVTVSAPGYETVSTTLTVEQKTSMPITLKKAIDVMISDRGPAVKVNRQNYGENRDVITFMGT